MYYLIPYAAMSLGAFAVVAARERELGVPVTLENLAGFGWERPFLGVSMWVFMLGFLGFPLTGGFIGKFYVFAAAYDRGWWWLIVAGVIATMISAYYYLGIVRAMYFRDAAELQLAPAGGSPPRELLLSAGVGDLPRRHGRLVLRGAAADRRRALGRARTTALVRDDEEPRDADREDDEREDRVRPEPSAAAERADDHAHRVDRRQADAERREPGVQSARRR